MLTKYNDVMLLFTQLQIDSADVSADVENNVSRKEKLSPLLEKALQALDGYVPEEGISQS